MRERERDRVRERERENERESERETVREREKERETDRQRERDREREIGLYKLTKERNIKMVERTDKSESNSLLERIEKMGSEQRVYKL